MLYPKNREKELSRDLFREPTAEYRGAPFWAWNDKLEPEELVRQIGELKEMGFGGFHMHPRDGMATPYLSEEHLSLIRLCNETAKQRNQRAAPAHHRETKLMRRNRDSTTINH